MTDDGDALRALLAIVDLDATPILVTLSLAQRELPSALDICSGEMVAARFRFARACEIQLAHCCARLNGRSVNRAALRKQGLRAELIEEFLGTSAPPRYAGEADPFVEVLRIDWPDASALLNVDNLAGLLMAPDHLLVGLLPDPWQLDPGLPRPRPIAPDFLRLSTAADLPPNVQGHALRSLELSGLASPEARELLIQAKDLRVLKLRHAGLLHSGLFDDLAWPALERLELGDASTLSSEGWQRVQQWPAIRSLHIEGLGMHQQNLQMLETIGQASFWNALKHLSLQLFTRHATLDLERWQALWAGRTFALETLQLRYLSAEALRSVWHGHFPLLHSLDLSDNDLRHGFPGALANAELPALEALDLRGNSIDPQVLRSFALSRAFPSLQRMAINLYGDEEEDYHDWNGALVGRGPVALSAREIESRWLVGSGLRVFDGLEPTIHR